VYERTREDAVGIEPFEHPALVRRPESF